MIGASFEDPLGIGAPAQIGNLFFVGQRGITYPDPNKTMALGYRINPHLRFLVNPLLAGHPDALAALIEFQAVIFADQVIAFQISLGERKQAMWAAILKSRKRSVGLAIQHDGLAANCASKRRMFDFVIPGDGIPSVSQEHRSPPRFTLRSEAHLATDASPSTI